MGLSQYDQKMVRITDPNGRKFTGVAEYFCPEYGMHEYGREEDLLKLVGYLFFESDIDAIEEAPNLEILRATETWQRAGAYYVRVQAMAKKHHIPLYREFDAHDGPDARYIVVTDADFPIATARMYPLDDRRMMIGRVVVLPEYRRQGIGTMVVDACEAWAEELSFAATVVESRENKVGFYEEIGYELRGEPVDGDTFRCVRMEKLL